MAHDIEGSDVDLFLKRDQLTRPSTHRAIAVPDPVPYRIANQQWHPGLPEVPVAVHVLGETPTNADTDSLEVGDYDRVRPNPDLTG